MDDLSFFRRFRLRKPTAMQVLHQIEPMLEFDNDLNSSVTTNSSVINQLLTTLRYYACGNHQISIGDFIGMHQTTVSRIVKKVSYAIATLAPNYIKMPTPDEYLRTQNLLMFYFFTINFSAYCRFGFVIY
ncbi:hypothetical protein NQ317_001096 [Molorchus minor]|uniref:Nuclease HARBI1 n=1 Tax=Molorchus minor TaxID=1323400 RepID=A0ABQ9J447_9CUCU|nr:hypothetical protein NQ317_001096 [Molorchus minor]